MNRQDVRTLAAEVLAGIAPEADLAAVGDGEDLRDALDLDSMDFLNLVIGLAQKTSRAIPEADYPKLFTLNGMAAYLAA
jgi:acyl carrier protein